VRIGLLRHFPVTENFPSGWKTAAELQAWRERYDLAKTSIGEFDLGGVDWQACLSSDLPRTRITASAVFRGEVGHTDLLREAQFATFNTGNLRLPVLAWKWMLRLSWLTGHRSQRACRDEFSAARVGGSRSALCARSGYPRGFARWDDGLFKCRITPPRFCGTEAAHCEACEGLCL
jgi:hypothetical protein